MPDDPEQMAHETNGLLRLLKLSGDLVLPPSEPYRLEPYLFEEYLGDAGSSLRRAYYSLKPLIPRWLQIRLRQRYAALQQARTFPSWPIETRVHDLAEGYLCEVVAANPNTPVVRIAPWPDGYRFAFVITHDVEWDSGLRQAGELQRIEKDLGFVSSWNLVPERYPIDWKIVDLLRDAGGEIGIHGLKHDGRLFESPRVFHARMAKIEEYARAWGAVGFRSPSTLRNPEWMRAMRFEWDSSFPDTDPYEPQPGGCCSVWPYFLGGMVELPLTMPQDHTVFEILGHADLRLWDDKVEWIERVGGLALINVHPDYMGDRVRLGLYEQFLLSMKRKPGMWNALPRDVARWWRERDASEAKVGQMQVGGPAAGRAKVISLDVRTGNQSGKP